MHVIACQSGGPVNGIVALAVGRLRGQTSGAHRIINGLWRGYGVCIMGTGRFSHSFMGGVVRSGGLKVGSKGVVTLNLLTLLPVTVGTRRTRRVRGLGTHVSSLSRRAAALSGVIHGLDGFGMSTCVRKRFRCNRRSTALGINSGGRRRSGNFGHFNVHHKQLGFRCGSNVKANTMRVRTGSGNIDFHSLCVNVGSP